MSKNSFNYFVSRQAILKRITSCRFNTDLQLYFYRKVKISNIQSYF